MAGLGSGPDSIAQAANHHLVHLPQAASGQAWGLQVSPESQEQRSFGATVLLCDHKQTS